ncbi:MAG: hypothetical protein ACI9KI_002013, partial [Patiriisocius sp.]
MKNRIKKLSLIFTTTLIAALGFIACSSDDGATDNTEEVVTTLHAAYEAFDTEATTIYLDGSNVVIETTGLP